MKKNDLNIEFLHYLMNKHGLFTDYNLYEMNITFDEYTNTNEEVLLKIENYLNKKKERLI